MFDSANGRLVAAWAAIVAITAGPLLGPVVYGSDVHLHFFRLPVVESMWAAGVVYSGWQPTLGYGYGYPLFSFYPPLSSYLYALIAQIPGVGAPLAFNAAFALAIGVAVVGMGLACRRLFGDVAAVVGPALYVWSPAFLAQLYERTSLPNAWSLAFFALALWAGVRGRDRGDWPWSIAAAVALGAMLLSHLASGLLLALVWLMLLLMWARRPWPVLALGLGLAISAFSWVPAVLDIGATQYRGAVNDYLLAQGDFTFSPLWRWPETVTAGLVNANVPARAGEAHVLLGLAALGWILLDRRLRGRSESALIAMALLIAIASVFVASEASAWLWHSIDALAQTQIPARWLDPAVPCLALAGAWVIGRWSDERDLRPAARASTPPSGALLIRAAPAVLTLAGAFTVALAQLYPPQYKVGLPEHPTLAHVRQVEERFRIAGLTSWGEYWPMRFVPGSGATPAVNAVDPAARLVPNARARVRVLEAGYNTARLQVSAEAATTLVFDIPRVTGWTAKVDGRPLTISTDPAGRMRLLVLSGESVVELAYTGSPAQQVTQWVSLAAALIVSLALAHSTQSPHPSLPLPARARSGSGALVLTLVALVAVKGIIIDRLPNSLVDTDRSGLVRPLAEATEPVEMAPGLELAGAELGPETVTVYWRVRAELDRDFLLSLKLQDALGREIAQTVVEPAGPAMTSRWMPGQIVRLVVPLPVFEPRVPYAYTLAVEVRDPYTGDLVKPGAVEIATLRAPPGSPKVDPMAALVQAEFGGVVRLEAARLPGVVRCGAPFGFHLRWVSVAPVNADLTVFVHVLDETGALVAGQDSQPLDGRFATSAWAPGDVVVDTRTWQLDLPRGTYRLQAGLYDALTGQRLALPEGATSVDLGSITVVCTPGASS